jgi:uncharacterized protein (DUF924 family)
MSSPLDWRTVYDFWFPANLANADGAAQWQRLEWWIRDGASPDLPRFAPLVQVAQEGRLDHWLETPRGRLSLIIVHDRFPRGLFAGTPEAFSSDPDTLRIADTRNTVADDKGFDKKRLGVVNR